LNFLSRGDPKLRDLANL